MSHRDGMLCGTIRPHMAHDSRMSWFEASSPSRPPSMLPLLHTNSPYTLSGEQLERNHTVGRYAILEAAVGRTLLRRMAGGLAAEFYFTLFHRCEFAKLRPLHAVKYMFHESVTLWPSRPNMPLKWRDSIDASQWRCKRVRDFVSKHFRL